MHRPTARLCRSLLVIAGVLSMGSAAHEAPSAPLTGEWGGSQVRLSLNEAGGRLDLACGSVHIAAPVQLNAKGAFTVEGTYEDFAGGPTPADVPLARTPARVSGSVDVNRMQLSVHRHGDKTGQDFVLEHGRRVKLIRCA